jgi:putative ABC transport system ATP-binding protein
LNRHTKHSEVQAPGAPIIEAKDLEKRVRSVDGELTILTAINLSILPAETVAIMGASGSGKSTLLTLLSGLDLPSHGTVRLAGHEITRYDEDSRAALRAVLVGFVFQSFQLLPSLTAEENVMLPLELSGRASPRASARHILQRVGLGARLRHYPNQLSGGEQQRVAIARAFVTQPKILFADEPTGNLDRSTGSRVAELLFSLNREHGTTLVIVTHDETLAAPCKHTLELDNGRIKA